MVGLIHMNMMFICLVGRVNVLKGAHVTSDNLVVGIGITETKRMASLL